ncbi:hypothetical protein [Kitasatospora purpeofusca]|uniref:hypothetical protein n=1 Tax=Kitasatospora purpeofusca TaxID=67352 RepID=UPI0036C9556B
MNDKMPEYVACPAPDCGRLVMVLPSGGLQPHRARGALGPCSMSANEVPDVEPATDEQWAEALAALDLSACPYPLSARFRAALASKDPETIREACRVDLVPESLEWPGEAAYEAAEWVMDRLTRYWRGALGE